MNTLHRRVGFNLPMVKKSPIRVALKSGLRQARFATICITDADGTYPNEMIPALRALSAPLALAEKSIEFLDRAKPNERLPGFRLAILCCHEVLK